MTDSRFYIEPGTERGHAVALYSGGLDSTLAILLMLKQNIRVTAITFMTHFGCDLSDRSACGSNPYPMAEKFGFEVKLMHLGQKFVDIVRDPKFGRGKNMNPCTDCRILMLSEGAEFMEMAGADFIVTGEVLGQRPMSQVKDKLNLTLNQTGLKGKVLRPLSAKLLPPTEPELSGMVDRERLEGITGRGRKRQMELAREYGVDDYPSPASGCLLTDPGYSRRLRDLIEHEKLTRFADFNLLRVGRHFRIDENTKAIVGRHAEDNQQLLALLSNEHVKLEAEGVGSPITILTGHANEENVRKAAMLTARYSAARNEEEVEVTVTRDGIGERITVPPRSAEEVGALPVY
jgi:tRNA U34 2-thiouridine synthase MnmA/TrmU